MEVARPHKLPTLLAVLTLLALLTLLSLLALLTLLTLFLREKGKIWSGVDIEGITKVTREAVKKIVIFRNIS